METKTEKWYTIPPYKGGDVWQIYDENGQFVASFEEREHCEKVVQLWNEQKK